jgi:hypothetical protein
MRRRLGTVVSQRAPVAAPNNALVVQRRHGMEPMSAWWLASWCMCWQWNFFTFFPIVVADMFKPALVYNKAPYLHFFHDKRQEAKLRKEMDNTYTQWTDELDRASIDDAISRTF